MKDDRRDREGMSEGRNPGILPDEDLIRFEEEHDRIISELGAYLGLFPGRSNRGSGTKSCDDAEEVRGRITRWCSDQLRSGQNAPDTVRGLRMAVTTFSDEQLLIFAEGLVSEAQARMEKEGVVPRLQHRL